LTFPAQQLFSALHDVVASLQIAPAGRQERPLSQRPTRSVGFDLLHVTSPVIPLKPLPPQQSASVLQISPVGRHPLGGWHICKPELLGAHARLQHEPPHSGMPPSVEPPSTTPPPHAVPARRHCDAPPGFG
jgi:hypothetical protein